MRRAGGDAARASRSAGSSASGSPWRSRMRSSTSAHMSAGSTESRRRVAAASLSDGAPRDALLPSGRGTESRVGSDASDESARSRTATLSSGTSFGMSSSSAALRSACITASSRREAGSGARSSIARWRGGTRDAAACTGTSEPGACLSFPARASARASFSAGSVSARCLGPPPDASCTARGRCRRSDDRAGSGASASKDAASALSVRV
mmetsp:Transcript_25398/g.60715  ORF Transcript_25398/g.60715 Transcript_25398/m.60715 type:complete len:209 (+) Transcript_25398:386-1012(+)